MSFFQDPPELKNQFKHDATLKSYLARLLPTENFKEIHHDLAQFGARVVGDIWEMCVAARNDEPQLRHYDSWGKRIDEIQVSAGWKALGRVAAQEGLLAIAYERKHQELSRLHQAAKLYLFNPSSAIYTCPLAMSDGAARLIEVHGSDELKNRAFQNLISRDAEQVWTSGQWMTERSGGSDISGTETTAQPDGANYLLSGTKWFTSATTSQMAMTLARVEGEDALSLFYLETQKADGTLNQIEIHRLKNKLGTRAMPTAELTMHRTPAQLIGTQGRGVAQMATLFNVTRIYNAITSVGYMRRGLALATDFAQRRKAFGKTLSEHPLHVRTLSELQARFMASFHLVFHVAHLQGKVECDNATDDEKASLRLMTPVAKLFTAKESVGVLSEILECFGGAGYMEDTHLPVLLRDAQVLPIWEGTTNVLSLDALRAIQKERAFEGWLRLAEAQKASVDNSLSPNMRLFLDNTLEWLQKQVEHEDMEYLQVNARSWALTLGKVSSFLLLAEQAQWENDHQVPNHAAHAMKVLDEMGELRPGAHRPRSAEEKDLVFS